MGRMKAASGDESDAAVAVDDGVADAGGAAAIAVENGVAKLSGRGAVTAEHGVADKRGAGSIGAEDGISKLGRYPSVAVDQGVAKAHFDFAIAVKKGITDAGLLAAVTVEHGVANPGLASLTGDGEISRAQGEAPGGVEQSTVGGLVGETETQQVGLGSLIGTFLLCSYRAGRGGAGGGRRLQRGRFLGGRELQRVKTALGVFFGRLRSLGQSPGGAGGPEAGVGNRRRDFSHRGQSSPQMP